MSLMLVARSAAHVALAMGWRQGDTIHGIHGRDEHRRGMASQRHRS
jgi:hypothetical protein